MFLKTWVGLLVYSANKGAGASASFIHEIVVILHCLDLLHTGNTGNVGCTYTNEH